MKSRAVYLDNFKGIAAFFVMVHHLLVAYLPVSYYGSNSGGYCDTPLVNWLSQTPFVFFFNGNFWVFIFLMVSGYIMFAQGSKINDQATFSSKFLTRYIKLLIPVIPICIIVFFLKNGLNSIFYNVEVGSGIGSSWLQNGYANPISFKDFIFAPFTIFLKGDDTFSNAFWMLDKLFISSLMVFVVAFAFQNVKKNKLFYYVLICLASLFLNSYYLPTFLGGLIYMLSSSNLKSKIKSKTLCILIATIALVFGFICAGYPSGRIPTNFYIYFEKYRILRELLPAVDFYHILGAFMVLLVVMNSNVLKRILEFKCFSILGKNSYSIYLIHIPIIYVLSPYLFVLFLKWTNGYLLATTFTIVLICTIVVIMSIYYTKFTSWLKKY